MKVQKICLINPPTTDPGEHNLFFPMALLTLGGVLKKMSVKAELWDFELYFKKVKNATEAHFRKLLRAGVDSVGTNIFGISAICSNLPMAIWIAKEIKDYRPDALIVLGGAQPSSVPAEILARFEFVDMIVVGEGEVTLEELIKSNFDRAALMDMPGVAFRSGTEIKVNAKRPLVPNMDDLPFPDYSLIRLDQYQFLGLEKFILHVEVGRGCPYNCTFCSTALMWEKDFRVKSPKRILDEMDVLYKEYGLTQFDFIHDNFTTSKKFIAEFCDFMERENSRGFTWLASSRTDCIDVPRLERMYAVGLRGFFFGVETGSEKMQKVIKKGLRFEHFEPIIKRANELGVSATTAFILGFPEEDIEDMDETVRRALHYKTLGTQRVFFSKISALTGTSLYRDYVEKLSELSGFSTVSPQYYGLPYINRLIKDCPHLFSSFYHIPHPKFSGAALLKFVEFAHLLVNGNPKITLMIIENLRMGATRLFSLWDDWAQKRDIGYFNFRRYSYEQFKIDFQQFLDEVLFEDVKRMTISKNLFPQCPVAAEV